MSYIFHFSLNILKRAMLFYTDSLFLITACIIFHHMNMTFYLHPNWFRKSGYSKKKKKRKSGYSDCFQYFVITKNAAYFSLIVPSVKPDTIKFYACQLLYVKIDGLSLFRNAEYL